MIQLSFMLLRMAHSIFTLVAPFIVSAQVSSVRLTVHVPVLPEGRIVFVAGSFNAWNAADSLYKMKKDDASNYSIVLPVYKNVKYQYKYTTGGWNNVEIALNDSNIKNRSFVAARTKKKIRDTVLKWASSKPAVQSTSPQMTRINAMKDSVLKGLQPKISEMLQLLKEYTFNLLRENPSIETDNRITADVVSQFKEAYGRINDLFHKVFESLTPEQRQQILKALSSPAAEKDFINSLGAALNTAVNK